MADTKNASVLLEHVDAAPAQTWNWLAINETSMEVPSPAPVAAALADGAQLKDLVDTEVPEVAQGIVMGAGTQATGWIDGGATDRRVVRVAAGERLEEPVTVLLDAAAGDLAQTTVLVEEGASARVLVLALGRETDRGTTGAATRIVAGPDSRVQVDLLVAQGAGQRHIDDFGALLDDGARLRLRQYILGSEASATGVSVDLLGEDAVLESDVRYVGRAGQSVDVSYEVLHHGRRTNTVIGAAGVLTGDAKKVLRATIDLVRGCKGAEGTETETVVVAGDEVVCKTLPVILCSEDDVAGNHGATIGSLSEDQLFYLACRGVTEDEATSLMASAIVDDAAQALGGEAAEAVAAWAAWNLGEEAAENARVSAELAGDPEKE